MANLNMLLILHVLVNVFIYIPYGSLFSLVQTFVQTKSSEVFYFEILLVHTNIIYAFFLIFYSFVQSFHNCKNIHPMKTTHYMVSYL